MTSWRSAGARRSGELAAFGRFCGALTLDDGRPLALEPFQRALLADYFAGCVETLVLLSKKNGKTTLLAALSLYHLIVTPDAECVVGAASRDQATILYDQAAGFVRRSEGLQLRVNVKRGYREIRSRRDAGRIRVLAADVDTADGVIPTLALVDELHRHRSADLYGVFRDGLGPRGGQMVTISTAGEDELSPLGLIRSAARELPIRRRRGRHLYARDRARRYALHEWALDAEDDSADVRVVKLANPASWQTVDALEARRTSPSMLPWQWERFACGRWVRSEAWWLDAETWQAHAVEDELRPGDAIALGFDGSRYGDSTALVACRIEDGLLAPLGVWEARPDDPEWEVPVGEVGARIAWAMDTFKVRRGYFDPPLWQSEIDEWARAYGEPAVLRFSTARRRMMDATERFRTDVAADGIPHVGDELLTRHVLNCHVREVRGGYWLAKARPGSPDKIDAAVAAVLAYEARADARAAGEPKRPGRLYAF